MLTRTSPEPLQRVWASLAHMPAALGSKDSRLKGRWRLMVRSTRVSLCHYEGRRAATDVGTSGARAQVLAHLSQSQNLLQRAAAGFRVGSTLCAVSQSAFAVARRTMSFRMMCQGLGVMIAATLQRFCCRAVHRVQGSQLFVACAYPGRATSEMRCHMRLRTRLPGHNNRLDITQIFSYDRTDGSAVSLDGALRRTIVTCVPRCLLCP